MSCGGSDARGVGALDCELPGISIRIVIVFNGKHDCGASGDLDIDCPDEFVSFNVSEFFQGSIAWVFARYEETIIRARFASNIESVSLAQFESSIVNWGSYIDTS